LTEKDDLLLRDSQVRDLGKAPPRHYRGLYNWVWGVKPLCPGKDDFIFHVEDFVSVAKHSQNTTPLADFIETFFDHCPESRIKVCPQNPMNLYPVEDKSNEYDTDRNRAFFKLSES
jgi:hypothetical protein